MNGVNLCTVGPFWSFLDAPWALVGATSTPFDRQKTDRKPTATCSCAVSCFCRFSVGFGLPFCVNLCAIGSESVKNHKYRTRLGTNCVRTQAKDHRLATQQTFKTNGHKSNIKAPFPLLERRVLDLGPIHLLLDVISFLWNGVARTRSASRCGCGSVSQRG